MLPSRTDHGQITEYDRSLVGDAESGYIAPDPKDPNIAYVSNTYGTLKRWDRRTSQGQIVTPWPAQAFGLDISQRKYRFPWTAPLVFSPVDHTLYYGSQYLLKTEDGGLNWQEISPDLTGARQEHHNRRSHCAEREAARLRRDLFHRAIARLGVRNLGGQRYRHHPSHARRRKNLAKHHASGLDGLEQDHAHRSVALPRGHRLRRRRPASAGRLQAVSFPHARLRKDVEADHGWNRGERFLECDSRGSPAPGACSTQPPSLAFTFPSTKATISVTSFIYRRTANLGCLCLFAASSIYCLETPRRPGVHYRDVKVFAVIRLTLRRGDEKTFGQTRSGSSLALSPRRGGGRMV